MPALVDIPSLHLQAAKQASGVRFPPLLSTILLINAASAVSEPPKVERVLRFEGEAGLVLTEHEYQLRLTTAKTLSLSLGGDSLSTNGTQYLQVPVGDLPVKLLHADGLKFDLLDLDIAHYHKSGWATITSFRGTKADGSQLHFQSIVAQPSDGDGPGEDFEKLTFPAEWTDLVEVQIIYGGIAIDNVRVRGFAVESYQPDQGELPQALSVVKLLNSAWRIEEIKNGKATLSTTNARDREGSNALLDLASGEIVHQGYNSDVSGFNHLTGERCQVDYHGKLSLVSGGQSKVIAETGRDGVDDISCPAVSNGRVIFANHWYQGLEKFAVFMAGPNGVVPLMTPATVLSDGGTPYSFPHEIHFRGNNFAIYTSSTKTSNCYFVSFNGGTMRPTPAVGVPIPGTDRRIISYLRLLWLDDESIGYLVESAPVPIPVNYRRGHSVAIMTANGSSRFVNFNSNGVMTSPPGIGYGHAQVSFAGYDDPSGARFTMGALSARDAASGTTVCLAVQVADGPYLLIARAGTTVEGFGKIVSFGNRVAMGNGEFYLTATNEQGVRALLKGTMPSAPPALRAAGMVPTADQSFRFRVENLTYDRYYRVERSSNLIDPWITVSRFQAGSRSRSVLGALVADERAFFRVVEE